MKKNPKIICIGWHKTGTSTMGMALLALGYKVVGARLDFSEKLLEGYLEPAIKEAGRFDALQDVPWAALFKELDDAYPGSKFILTTRDENQWLKSAAKHFKDKYFKMHEWLYGNGILEGNEQLYLQRYRDHYKEVNEYFKSRPEDLLVMNFAAGDGWAELCNFLNRPVPKKKFPHANKGRYTYSFAERLFFSFKNFIPLPLRKWRVQLLVKMGFEDKRNRFNNHLENKN